jgi:Holliday junction DNA helicase RuvB
LLALIDRFGGGPVGLSTMAMAVGEENETIESICEPFLLRAGLLARTPRGRMATPAAWLHVGRTPPASAAALAPTFMPETGEQILNFGD